MFLRFLYKAFIRFLYSVSIFNKVFFGYFLGKKWCEGLLGEKLCSLRRKFLKKPRLAFPLKEIML